MASIKKLYTCIPHGVEPNSCTFLTLFKACRNEMDICKSMDICKGRKLHAKSHEKGFTSDIFDATRFLLGMYDECEDITSDNFDATRSLLGMYDKCEDITQAEIVFEKMHHHDDVRKNPNAEQTQMQNDMKNPTFAKQYTKKHV